jgi:hypothetical protein
LRAVIPSQTFPDILLVDTFDSLGQLLYDIFFDAAKPLDDLEVKVGWVNQGGKLSENRSRGRGQRSKVAREFRCEERVLENLWDGDSSHRIDGQHSLD